VSAVLQAEHQFGNLDQSKTWLLWCERGVMSRLQALYAERALSVKVYRPPRTITAIRMRLCPSGRPRSANQAS
jgi:rhodanese-related sulfurtransferase